MDVQHIRSSDLVRLGLSDRHLRRRAAAGALVRVLDGVFITPEAWRATRPRQHYVERIIAMIHGLTGDPIVSHISAAALVGLPHLDGWPRPVHVIDRRRRTGRRSPTLVRHASVDLPATRMFHGVAATTAVRTAVDCALGQGLGGALVMYDAGIRMRLFSTDELAREVAARGRGVSGIGDVRRALELVDPLSATPGESFSRAVMVERGFPPPVLQKRFPNPAGGSYFVDFWWEEFGLIGEFDGDQKYLDEAMRSGLSIEQVMLAEKQRESDLRALPEVRNVVRWRYGAARAPDVLTRMLVAAGLPREGLPATEKPR